jgi:predicted nucleic acid-binding protein
LPAPFRVTTAQARELIEEWVFRDAELAVLQANEVLRLLQEAAEVHLAGGAIYDSIIAMSCKNAGAVEFLTFNLRHMERFHTSGFRVHRP